MFLGVLTPTAAAAVFIVLSWVSDIMPTGLSSLLSIIRFAEGLSWMGMASDFSADDGV